MTEMYTSPPVTDSTLLQQIVTTLLVSCMMKPAVPRLTISPMQRLLAGSRRKGSGCTRYSDLQRRKYTTNAAESSCESTVAAAAPRMPMPNTKMNTGSSTRLAAAPIITLSIPAVA